jgi:hypothetical protein
MAKEYTINEGDSYWDIAEKMYGGDLATINANRKRLQELNAGKRLFPGEKLVIDNTPEPARDSGDKSESRREQNKAARSSMTEPKNVSRERRSSMPDPKGIGGATKRTGLAPKVAPPAGFLTPSSKKPPASIALSQRLSMTDPKSVSSNSQDAMRAEARKNALRQAAQSDDRRAPVSRPAPKPAAAPAPSQGSITIGGKPAPRPSTPVRPTPSADDRRAPVPRPAPKPSVPARPSTPARLASGADDRRAPAAPKRQGSITVNQKR